jgi:hypothetical protein
MKARMTVVRMAYTAAGVLVFFVAPMVVAI